VTVGGLHNGVNIDLSNFDEVDFDTETNLLTVGAAVRFENIIDLLYDAGKQFRK
jgi:FAD/FMN-containing dehydrogenase